MLVRRHLPPTILCGHLTLTARACNVAEVGTADQTVLVPSDVVAGLDLTVRAHRYTTTVFPRLRAARRAFHFE
jgi:hypothetical protein